MTSVPSGCPHLPHVPASTPWPDLLLLCHFRSGRSTAPTQMQHCLLRFWEKDHYSLHLQLTVLPTEAAPRCYSTHTLTYPQNIPYLLLSPHNPFGPTPVTFTDCWQLLLFHWETKRTCPHAPTKGGGRAPPSSSHHRGAYGCYLGTRPIHSLVPSQGHGSSSVPSSFITSFTLYRITPHPQHENAVPSPIPTKPSQGPKSPCSVLAPPLVDLFSQVFQNPPFQAFPAPPCGNGPGHQGLLGPPFT